MSTRTTSHPAPPAPEKLPATSGESRRVGWIGGLDGLRAVAVIAVVLFHLNPGYLTGGFLGVDLFFVISGYLITRLLVAEWLGSGRVRLGRFYVRRVKRLLPAVLALLAVAVTAGGLLWPDQRATLSGSAGSSLAYVTNWWLITDQQSYFVAMGRPPMLQHLWSLAIEEQYYLLWAPAVMAIAAAWWRRRSRTVAASAPAPSVAWRAPVLVATVAAVLAVASTVAMAVIAISSDVPYQTDSSRVYFGTDTHAMGLLLGSALGALAAVPWRLARRRTPRWVRPAWRATWPDRALLPAWVGALSGRAGVRVTDGLALAGFAGAAWFFVSVDEYQPWLYRGGFLAFAAASAVAICCAARVGSRAGALLDIRPLTWIGRRSYGIYLWHWPVFVVTRPLIDVQGPQWLIDCCRAGLAVALAAASYRYLETPIRTGTFVASVRRARRAWCELAARWATSASRVHDGDRPPTRRRGFARHGLIPALGAVCAAVLVSAHLAAVQQPVWAASIPDAPPPAVAVTPVAPQAPSTALGAEMTSHSVQRQPTTHTTTAETTPTRAVTSAPWATPSTPTPASIPEATPGAAQPLSARSKTAFPMSSSPAAPPPKSSAAAANKAAPPAISSVAMSAFGDSVLLGASKAVRSVVGSMSVDAVVGRQAWDTLADVTAAHQAKKLAPVVLIHTGNNGVISPQQLSTTLAGLKDRSKVLLINDHVDRAWEAPNNKAIAGAADKYPNVMVVDWNAAANKSPAWFGPDGIHVNAAGAKAYATLVAAALD